MASIHNIVAMIDDAIANTALGAPLRLDEADLDSMEDAPSERAQSKLQQEFNPVIMIDDSDEEMGLAEEQLRVADPEIHGGELSMQIASEPAHIAVTSDFGEDQLFTVMHRELLSELRGHLLAWELGCRAVTIGKLWQLHTDVKDQGADQEEMLRLAAHIQSLSVTNRSLPQGEVDGDERDSQVQVLPPVSLCLVEAVPQPTIQPRSSMADIENHHGARVDTSKPESENHIEVVIKDTALMVTETEILSPPGVGKPAPAETVFRNLPHINTSAPETISDASRYDYPDMPGARMQEPARSWLSFAVCSRRSQRISKRKAAHTTEEGSMHAQKHPRL